MQFITNNYNAIVHEFNWTKINAAYLHLFEQALERFKTENHFQGNYFLGFFFFITIPLPLAVNNVVLVLWTLFSILSVLKINLSILQIIYLFLFSFFVDVGLFFWSIDPVVTTKAIPKEITLLLIPLNFMCCVRDTLTSKVSIWLKYYSHFMVLYALFFLARALLGL